MKILFLDCDTLRPDHLGCYGYERATSENIDALAGDSICFDDYYCSDAPCLPSRAAMMSGRFGIHNGLVGHGGTAGDMRSDGKDRGMKDSMGWYSLPGVMKRYGMHTASISSFPERHGARWFAAGYREWYDPGVSGDETAERVAPMALDWLERHQDQQDWFLHVHFWDPHTPYRTPPEEGKPFEDAPLPARFDWASDEKINEHRNRFIGPHSAYELQLFNDHTSEYTPRQLGQIKNRADFKHTIDEYDTSVQYMDKHIGRILDWLKEKGIYEETAVILTSDHGEDLGEIGQYSEHGIADYATTHIPLVIKWPNMPKNIHLSGLHYNVDLLPTLMDLLGEMPPAPVPPSVFNISEVDYDGVSFAENIQNAISGGRDYLVVSQCAHVCQRSVRFGDWLYIRTYHDGYHLYPDEMLFNIAEDPFECHDVSKDHPQMCWKGAYLMEKWHTENMKKMVYDCQIDPLWTVIAEGGPYHTKKELGGYIERLKSTGREWAVDELLKRHSREL